MRFRGIKLVGLLVFALGVMAIGAGVAQAESTAKWLVGSVAVSGNLLPQVQAVGAGIESEEGSLEFKSGLSVLDILCPEFEIIDGLLHAQGKSSAKALLFKKCEVEINHKPAPNCNPTTPGSTAGHITTNPLIGLLILHNSGTETLNEVKPETGAVIVSFSFGSKCAFGSKVSLTGVGFLKDCEGAFLKEQAIHLVVEGPLSALKLGESMLTLVGSATLQLVNDHQGKLWSGHAG